MSPAATPRARRSSTPASIAFAGSAGVEGTLATVISPLASSTYTKSENVPPVSTVSRYISYDSIFSALSQEDYTGDLDRRAKDNVTSYRPETCKGGCTG